VDGWNKGTLKALLIPGAALLLLGIVLFQGGFLPISAAVTNFYYYAVFAAGILLAVRFHSSRVLFALLILLLAHRAMEFFSAGLLVSSGPGRIAFEAIAFLVPVDFIILSLMRERGLTVPSIASRLGLIFVESVFVAVICRPGETTGPAFLHPTFLNPNLLHWTRIPQVALLAFAVAFAVLLIRFVLHRNPVESGLLWSLAATLLALQTSGVGRIAAAYLATGGLILIASIIENSYLLAYHDELTGLPARRAFNEELLQLVEPYSIAVVDIDHFKSFNDTYGHDTGDDVLRMVAGRLAEVTGGGQAFRVGGEEFSILFPGKSVEEVAPHLELLRTIIEGSAFRVRNIPERRRAPRGADRRITAHGRTLRRRPVRRLTGEVSVTVSIGVAEPGTRTRDVQQVIQAADKALYRAKQSGRNRVEIANPSRSRV
jgi:diguanylate cyclase (GGDEF)-like protein